MSHSDDLPPTKPECPDNAECCHSDCAPNCIFDVYERAMEQWREDFARWQARQNKPSS